MGVLDVLRAGAVAGQNAPQQPQQPAYGSGHTSAYGAIGAALAASPTPQEQQAAQQPQRGIFNIIDTSAIDSILNGGKPQDQQAQQPESSNVPSAQQTQFVKDVYPHAVDAAKQIGVDPSVLVAQAGLETGWGKSFPKNDDGSNSFNYFSIKPGSKWTGAVTAATTTHEQDAQGNAHTENDAFRSYPNAAASFADYVAFLKSNPRYAEALKNAPGQDATAYATALQKAGYATDVDYGRKVGATARTVHAIATQ